MIYSERLLTTKSMSLRKESSSVELAAVVMICEEAELKEVAEGKAETVAQNVDLFSV